MTGNANDVMKNPALTFKAHPLEQVKWIPHEGLVANRQHSFGGVVCQISHTRTPTSCHQHRLKLHDVCWGWLKKKGKRRSSDRFVIIQNTQLEQITGKLTTIYISMLVCKSYSYIWVYFLFIV